jgi:hypothetical protein
VYKPRARKVVPASVKMGLKMVHFVGSKQDVAVTNINLIGGTRK